MEAIKLEGRMDYKSSKYIAVALLNNIHPFEISK